MSAITSPSADLDPDDELDDTSELDSYLTPPGVRHCW